MTPYIILPVVVAFLALRVWQRRRKRTAEPTGVVTSHRSVLQAALGDVGLVARREIRERVRGRIFQVGTALILIVVAGAVIIPVLTKSSSQPGRIGIVGTTTPALQATLDGIASSLGEDVVLVTEQDLDAAKDDLRSGDLDLVVDGSRLLVNKPIAADDTSTTAEFVRAAAQTLGVDDAYAAAALTPAQTQILTQARALPVTSLQPASPPKHAHPTSLIALILVFVMLSQYNTWILTGVVEEKASRVVEVLLAAVRPMQLLAGKVLGIGLVAFAQAAVILGFALGLAEAVGSNLLAGTGPLALTASLVWLVLGYAFYSWVYAAAGSTAERSEQVQTLAFPLTLPLLFGYIVSITAATSGHASTLVHVLAYLPPTAPFAMPVLVGVGDATWWQFGGSMVISIVGTVLVARLATTIYRRAILRTGRRVHLREVLFTRGTAR